MFIDRMTGEYDNKQILLRLFGAYTLYQIYTEGDEMTEHIVDVSNTKQQDTFILEDGPQFMF